MKPISPDFGWERGTPIDRFYIENFLSDRAGDIVGRVLEIGDDVYSKRFGGAKIEVQDVLHVKADHPKATITGNLAQNDVLPKAAFDCIVFTQTLQFIFELEQAIDSLYDSLKPGGVLLATVPGLSQIDRGEWKDSWYWSFTAASVRQLFARRFGSEMLKIETHGNVFAATAFLQGAAFQEVDQELLTVNDPAYQLVITLRARKR